MRRLLVLALLLGGAVGFPSASLGGMYLGSFENPTSGNDSPDAAVIAAILAATGDEYLDLTRLYKNDAPGSESGLAVDHFDVEYTGDKNHGTITGVDLDDLLYTPLFYTVKIDGQNAGFNLYSWEGNSNSFDNVFWKDTENGLTYTYVHNGQSITNSWANKAGTNPDLAVSHVSVWGVLGPPDGGPSPIPEPSSMLIWAGALAALGLAMQRRRNRLAA